MPDSASNPFKVDWLSYLPDLGEAIVNTIGFTVVGFVAAAVLGLIWATMRMSPIKLVRGIAYSFVELFKNVPLLTEIYIIYFGLSVIGIRLSPFVGGSIALAIHYGAYLSEIFRGGLQGVRKGHVEAAQAVGLGKIATFVHIVIPEAVRLALPGTNTMLVDLLKGTSLMVTIGGAELMTEGTIITSDTFRALEVYAVIGAIYFALCFPLSRLTLTLENKLRRGEPLLWRRRRFQGIVRGVLAKTGERADYAAV